MYWTNLEIEMTGSWLVWLCVGFCVAFVVAFRTSRARRRNKQLTERQHDWSSKNGLLMRQLAEQTRREEERKAWLAENPITLHYNTMDGIAAVLVPRDFEENRRRSEERRQRGGANVTTDRAVIFVATPSGAQLLASNGGDESCVHGTSNDLASFVDRWKARLVHSPEIFVPHVNEALLPFHQHRCMRRKDSWHDRHRAIQRRLAEAQMPRDLRTEQD